MNLKLESRNLKRELQDSSFTLHVPVMLEDSMLALEVPARPAGGRPNGGTGGRDRRAGVYVDGTLGGGSHSGELLRRSSPDGRVYSFDVNPKALAAAATTLAEYGERWTGIDANFRHLDRELLAIGVREGSVDGILLDLGFSSDEIRDPAIGLSFQTDGPLDMRLGPKANEDGLTASDIVNTWSEKEIATMIRNFGEEKFAGRIANAIVRARKSARLVRTLELVSIIRGAIPANYGRTLAKSSAMRRVNIHPATRTFQALRIAVNDELESLKDAIKASHRMLKPGGRLVIITFHSLEDRIVKLAFKEEGEWETLTKKPMVPLEQEQLVNPRSRSAKLRVARKK